MEDHPEENASPQSFWDELVDFEEIVEAEEEVDKNNESNQSQTTDVLDLREINPVDLIRYERVLATKDAVKQLEERLS